MTASVTAGLNSPLETSRRLAGPVIHPSRLVCVRHAKRPADGALAA